MSSAALRIGVVRTVWSFPPDGVDTEQGRPMSGREVWHLWTMVDELAERGWGIPELAQALAYADPSSLYDARRERRGITIGRYREVRRIHAEGLEPPARTPRSGSVHSLSGERFTQCERLVGDLERKGHDKNDLARVARYASTAGFRMALRRGSVPVDAFEALHALAVREGVRPDPATQGDPDAIARLRWSAFDYFEEVARLLARADLLLAEAAENVGNVLTRPGLEQLAQRVRSLAQDVREVVDGK